MKVIEVVRVVLVGRWMVVRVGGGFGSRCVIAVTAADAGNGASQKFDAMKRRPSASLRGSGMRTEEAVVGPLCTRRETDS